jgi:hypothetical protein
MPSRETVTGASALRARGTRRDQALAMPDMPGVHASDALACWMMRASRLSQVVGSTNRTRDTCAGHHTGEHAASAGTYHRLGNAHRSWAGDGGEGLVRRLENLVGRTEGRTRRRQTRSPEGPLGCPARGRPPLPRGRRDRHGGASARVLHQQRVLRRRRIEAKHVIRDSRPCWGGTAFCVPVPAQLRPMHLMYP